MDEPAALRIILRLENALHGVEESLSNKTLECAQAVARGDQLSVERDQLAAELDALRTEPPPP